MLARQYRVWAEEWPAELKRDLEVIIVDDGSPEPAADVVRNDRALPLIRIFRVLEDRPWHQHGARNLGASQARGDFLLMTDMDHVIPSDTLELCYRTATAPELYRRTVVTFARVDAPASSRWTAGGWPAFEKTKRADGSLKPHVNSFLLTRALYWEVGGYDESYCGLYGTDGRFRKRLYQHAVERPMPFPLIRVARDVIADASTRDVARKEGRERGAKKRIAAAKRKRGEADKIVTLNFPWEQVA